jgi:hypothetical protein
MNPYITQVPSYMAQDAQGLNPVFQNAATQQQYMNQQLAQSNQMTQPQQQQHLQSPYGINPVDLAKMLRKDPNNLNQMMNGFETPNYNNPYTNTGGYLDQSAYGNNYGVGTGGFE